MKNKIALIVLAFLISAVTVPHARAQYRLIPAFPQMPGLFDPLELINAGDGSNRLFVLQQNGLVYVFPNDPNVINLKTFIDLRSKVTQGGSETGLLGMAFHPNFKNNRYVFVNYTFDSSGNGSRTWSRIERYTVSPTDPDSLMPGSAEIFMTLSQPDINHKAGRMQFGPDGYLYISFGDGGGDGDPGNHAQNKFDLFGKIIRINIDSASGGKKYSIPVTNPFYGTGYAQEIFCYGLRNTWKFSIDFPTNRIWGGDVGQERFEEINILQSGKNYGYNKMEGNHCYPDTLNCDTAGKGFTLPLFEYRHNVSGNCVIGGYVYRGKLLPDLYGKYIYGDFIFGTIWAMTYDGANPPTNMQVFDSTLFLSAFGLDESGEIYVCRYSATAGRIYKLVDAGKSMLNVKAIPEAYYNDTLQTLNRSDTVTVYLRSLTSPFAIADSARTTVDSLSFGGLCFFSNAPTDRYYIQLVHRNSMSVWSREGGDSLIRGQITNYDFTSDSSMTLGNNVTRVGNKFCMYSGDVTEQSVININDVIKVYNDLVTFTSGYVTSDVDGNGIVDLRDLIVTYNNSEKFVSMVTP